MQTEPISKITNEKKDKALEIGKFTKIAPFLKTLVFTIVAKQHWLG